MSRRRLLGIGVAAVPAVVLVGAASVGVRNATAADNPAPRPTVATDAAQTPSDYVYFC